MPITTDQLLHIHMPKTGGLWVGRVLLAAGGTKVAGLRRHDPHNAVPDEVREGRLVFGTIRDPWSWYLSFWRHLRVGRDGQMLLRQLGRGDQNFGPFLRGATDPGVWCRMPDSLTSGWWDWPVGGDGLYTETFRAIYGEGGHGVDALIDTAQLTVGLSELLGIDVSGFPIQNRAADRERDSIRHPHRMYEITQGAEKVVRKYDGEMAHALGYDGPFSQLRSPIRWAHDSELPARWRSVNR